jgi:hypothetical protein
VIGDEHLVFAMAMPAWGIAIADSTDGSSMRERVTAFDRGVTAGSIRRTVRAVPGVPSITSG